MAQNMLRMKFTETVRAHSLSAGSIIINGPNSTVGHALGYGSVPRVDGTTVEVDLSTRDVDELKSDAAIVDSARVAPMDASIMSPAMIMIALSTNPKATKGRPDFRLMSAYCLG